MYTTLYKTSTKNTELYNFSFDSSATTANLDTISMNSTSEILTSLEFDTLTETYDNSITSKRYPNNNGDWHDWGDGRIREETLFDSFDPFYEQIENEK
jgi:hypothetical protein